MNMVCERARVTIDETPPSPVTPKVRLPCHVSSLSQLCECLIMPQLQLDLQPPVILISVTFLYVTTLLSCCSLKVTLLCLSLQSSLKKSVTMQQTPSEVFHYTDSGGHSDAIHLSKSSTILQAAKKDLLGIIQLQVRGPKLRVWIIVQHKVYGKLLLVLYIYIINMFCRIPACLREE